MIDPEIILPSWIFESWMSEFSVGLGLGLILELGLMIGLGLGQIGVESIVLLESL